MSWPVAFVVLFVFVAVIVLDVTGVILVIRYNRRLSPVARTLVGVVAAFTVAWALVDFLQEATDWAGALATSAFEVLYGLIACGVVILVDLAVRRMRRRPKPLSV